MGFLSKLFGKKDETDDILKMINKTGLQRKNSANYHLACVVLRQVFFEVDIPNENFYNKVKATRLLLNVAIEECIKDGIRIPKSYKDLPVTFVSNANDSKFGYIISFNDAKHECECNFVALMVVNNEKVYFTNEFYESEKSFGLCRFDANGRHYFGMGEPQTYEEFKDAILG